MLPGFMYLKINNDNTLILVIENIEFRHRQLYFTFFFLYKTFYGVKAKKTIVIARCNGMIERRWIQIQIFIAKCGYILWSYGFSSLNSFFQVLQIWGNITWLHNCYIGIKLSNVWIISRVELITTTKISNKVVNNFKIVEK